MVEKLSMTTSKINKGNIEWVSNRFPNVVTEGKDDNGKLVRVVDFDALRQELSENIVEGPQERYSLDWPGKRQAMLTANTPITKTLRPSRQESVDFDKTRNLFIEGDNLDVLKLLQETYLGKVKMIYIDPPYNTGKDFIYKDNFTGDKQEYLEDSGQVGEGGSKLVANPESNGRYHSDWLSMMYPRLKLARNLLANDGVIFASIGDEESANLKRMLADIFGENNFVDTIAVELSTTSGPKTVNAQQGTIVKNVEFIHIFKRSDKFEEVRRRPLFDGIKTYDTHYNTWMNDDGSLSSLSAKLLSDDAVHSDIDLYGLKHGKGFSLKSIDKLMSISEATRTFINDNLEKIVRIDRAPISANGQSTEVGCWKAFKVDHRTYFLTSLSNGKLQALMPLSLNFRMSDDYKPSFGRTVIRGDLWKGFYQDMGNVAKEGGIAYSNGKKPVRLIEQLAKWCNVPSDGIVLDFFAGSGTTAHSILQINASDQMRRKYILVQLDEKPNVKSAEAKAGITSIADLTRKRIRRAGEKILEENPEQVGKLDVGFRALKIDDSNMHDVYYSPSDLAQTSLLDTVEHIKSDRSSEDLLFQVMLDWGVDLSLPIVRETIEDKMVFWVGEKDLAACFEMNVTENLVKTMASRKPLRAVFRDDGFSSDDMKINADQLFKQMTDGHTDMKVV